MLGRWMVVFALLGAAVGCSERDAASARVMPDTGPAEPEPMPEPEPKPFPDGEERPDAAMPDAAHDGATPDAHDGGRPDAADADAATSLPGCDEVESTAYDLCVPDDDEEVDWDSCIESLSEEYGARVGGDMRAYLIACCRGGGPVIGPRPPIIPFGGEGDAPPPATTTTPTSSISPPRPDPGLLWCETLTSPPPPTGLTVRHKALPELLRGIYNFSSFEVLNLEATFDEAQMRTLFDMVVTQMGGTGDCSEMPVATGATFTAMTSRELMSLLGGEAQRWVEKVQGDQLNQVENYLGTTGFDTHRIFATDMVGRNCGRTVQMVDGRVFFIWNETDKSILFLTLHRSYPGSDDE